MDLVHMKIWPKKSVPAERNGLVITGGWMTWRLVSHVTCSLDLTSAFPCGCVCVCVVSLTGKRNSDGPLMYLRYVSVVFRVLAFTRARLGGGGRLY